MSFGIESIQRKTVVLQITENCNLNCVYCYQHSKQRSVIDEARLKQIILDSFAEKDSFAELEFDFIGGEPLLCMPLIRRVCEWTWAEEREKNYIFFATTNGTTLTEEDKAWFTENKDRFWLGLSLDGTREMHNTNRSNSYDRIDREFFLRNWPEQDIKMTVSPKTLRDFSKGVIELHEYGFRLSANLAYGVDWSDPDNVEVLSEELRKLADYYLEHEEITPIMLMNMGLFRLTFPEPERYCGAGIGMASYDVRGRRFPCQMYYDTTGETMKGWENTDFSELHKKYYANCRLKPLFNICPICLGMSYSFSGTRFECDPDLCKLMQVFFKANAYLQSQQILRGRVRASQEVRAADIVKGIRIIDETLS